MTITKEHSVKEWDVCAPAIILEEAGGKITTIDGKPLVYNKEEKDFSSPIVASNKIMHEELIEHFKTFLQKNI